MKKTTFKYIFLILFIFSLILNIFFSVKINRPQTGILVGSYASPNANSSQAEYLIFTQDGKYYFYEQGESASELGTYQEMDEKVLLIPYGNASYEVFHSKNTIYVFRDNEVLEFNRFSNIPTFINVE